MPSSRRRNSDTDNNRTGPTVRRRRIDVNRTGVRDASMERLTKEELEARDAQLALELQREEEERLIREREVVIEPTLSPSALARILTPPPHANQANNRGACHLRRNLTPTMREHFYLPVANAVAPTGNNNEDEEIRDFFDGELTLEDDSSMESDTDDSDGDGPDASDNDSDEEGSNHHGPDPEILMESSSSDGFDDSSDEDTSESEDEEDAERRRAIMEHRNRAAAALGMTGGIDFVRIMLGQQLEPRSPSPTPEPVPDETVIQCSDWGQCTICFEEAPYDPVGCLHCLQLIGCKICVNRWFHGGRNDRATSPLSLGHSRANHRQCPLCRHEFEGTPEVASMFTLAPKE